MRSLLGSKTQWQVWGDPPNVMFRESADVMTTTHGLDDGKVEASFVEHGYSADRSVACLTNGAVHAC